ncbi:MAG: hypothetical protein ACE5EN_06215 [Nitrospinota bacterium]
MELNSNLPINDPMTVATDYLIALVCLFFAYRLYARYKVDGQKSILLWSLAFSFTAAASLAGGSYHGINAMIPDTALIILWKTTIYSIGLAGLTMLAGTVIATFVDPVRVLLLIFITAKFLAYGAWMVNHNLFLYVIVDYGSGMLLLLLLQFYSYYRRHDQKVKWLIGGVLVSFLAAAVQQSGIRLHQYFNHNDLYHVIQLAGLCLFYKGASQYVDAGS